MYLGLYRGVLGVIKGDTTWRVRDLVSGLIMKITRDITWVTRLINLVTKSP